MASVVVAKVEHTSHVRVRITLPGHLFAEYLGGMISNGYSQESPEYLAALIRDLKELSARCLFAAKELEDSRG